MAAMTTRWRRAAWLRVSVSRPTARFMSQPPSDRFRSQHGPEPEQLGRRPAEAQLELLGPQEVAVQGVVPVDPDAAVQMLGSVDHPLAAIGRPELGHGDLG